MGGARMVAHTETYMGLVEVGMGLIPGMPTPVNGRVTPSDAPGFGLELKDDNILPW